jgi:hypothetical protein
MVYGYEARPTDYSFIAAAGQQIGQGIKDVAIEKKAELEKIEAAKKVKLKNDELKAVHEKIMQQTAQDYMEATGETDPVKAHAFAAKHFYPPGTDEDPTLVQTRWINAGSTVQKAIQEAKVKKYHEKANQQTVVKPAVEGKPAEPQVAANLTARLLGEQQTGKYDTSITGTPEAAIPPQPAVMGSMPTSERRALAGQLGVSEDKSVASNIQGQEDIQTGQEYFPGQNSPEYLAGMAARGIDTNAGTAKQIADKLPTPQQLLTNERLTKQEEQRNRMRTTLAAMQEKRLRAQDMDRNAFRVLDTEIKALQAQIDASEATSKLALGLPTGKDYMGQTQYSTGTQWEKEYTDAETTLRSAQATLERVSALNRKINPSPADKPPALPSTMTESEKQAYDWLKNPANAKDPDYVAVKTKLATKYPDLVR